MKGNIKLKTPKSICGADCSVCGMKESCKGCLETNGCPFGERCIASEYIKLGGIEAYTEFKKVLLNEINELLDLLDIPKANKLYEIPGAYIDLGYPLPNGKTVRFLNDKRIYLGCQIEFADRGICYGVAADTSFILVCSYSVNGSNPELIMYKKR